jgi:hypothetical protein
MRLLAELVLVAIAAGAVAICLACVPKRASARWRRATIPPPPRPKQLTQLERLVVMSEANALTAHAYLRPVLAEIASRRLAARGHALDRMPGSVGQQILGEHLWDLVRPDRPFPDDRHGPGVAAIELAAMLQVLERM